MLSLSIALYLQLAEVIIRISQKLQVLLIRLKIAIKKIVPNLSLLFLLIQQFRLRQFMMHELCSLEERFIVRSCRPSLLHILILLFQELVQLLVLLGYAAGVGPLLRCWLLEK